jgi:hypothetical protein
VGRTTNLRIERELGQIDEMLHKQKIGQFIQQQNTKLDQENA